VRPTRWSVFVHFGSRAGRHAPATDPPGGAAFAEKEMPISRRSNGRLTWILILGCVALAAFLSLACAPEGNGDSGLTPCAVNESSFASDTLSRELPLVHRRPPTTAAAVPYPGDPNCLAAVPGGLCLLD
jgi:hypothetical protein